MATFILCLIGISPALFIWLRERLLRRLSESRLVIAKSVTEMEQLLLDRQVTIGDVSHDVLFARMRNVQNKDAFSIRWSVLRQTPQHVEDLLQSLRSEMDEEDCQFRHIVHSFSCNYFRAFRFKHPIKCVAYIIWLFTIASGLSGTLLLLKTVLAVLKGFDHVRVSARNVRNLAADTFVALSFSVNGAQTA